MRRTVSLQGEHAMSEPVNQTTTTYTVVYEVTGDREKHDEWWRMIQKSPAGINVKATASFDALAKLNELEGPAW